MKHLSMGVILVGILFSSIAYAEPFVTTVPGQAWQIVINLPPIDEYQGQTRGKRFAFLGKSSQSGLMVSFIGEPWSSGGVPECRSSFWSKSSQNPVIDKSSVKIVDGEKVSRIVYISNPEVKKQKIKQANAEFFFVFKGNCVDVHLSKVPYQEGDEKTLLAIGSSLSWVGSK